MASLRDSIASFLRRRLKACLLLVPAAILSLSGSVGDASERRWRILRLRWAYSEEALLRIGPQYFQEKNFVQVHAVVSEGAQVFFDYRLEGKGALTVRIDVNGKTEELLRFPEDGYSSEEVTEGSWSSRLPEDLGEKPHVAIFSFRAFGPSRESVALDIPKVGVGYPSQASTAQHGIRRAAFAPGGRLPAQDSTGVPNADWLSEVKFEPSDIQIDDEAKYSFSPYRSFNELEARIFYSKKGGEAIWEQKPRCHRDRSGETCEGIWSGRDRKKSESIGQHELVVAAWLLPGKNEDRLDWYVKKGAHDKVNVKKRPQVPR